MGVVRMSQEYFNVIKTINSMMKMKAGLIFKGKGSDGQYTGKYYFNGICDSAMIHVVATEHDIAFDEPRLQISSLPDFIKYAEATGFPNVKSRWLVNEQSVVLNTITSSLLERKRMLVSVLLTTLCMRTRNT